jgi:hypothetical protein
VAVFDVKAIVQMDHSSDESAHRRLMRRLRRRAEEEETAEEETTGDLCDHNTCVYMEIWDASAGHTEEGNAPCYSFKKLVVDGAEEMETLQVVSTNSDSFKCDISSDNADNFYFRVSTNSEAPIALVFQVDAFQAVARCERHNIPPRPSTSSYHGSLSSAGTAPCCPRSSSWESTSASSPTSCTARSLP